MFAYILEHNSLLHNKSTPSKPALKNSLFSKGKLFFVVNERREEEDKILGDKCEQLSNAKCWFISLPSSFCLH